MPQHSMEVTFTRRKSSRIPDSLTEGAGVLVDLFGRGRVDETAQRLRVRRQGGYCAVDAWLVLILYFASGMRCAVKDFWATLGPHVVRIAALAGRSRLPSPSALSRLLGRAENELVRPAASWLLMGASEIDEVLRHPAAQSYDALGRGWHVFDLDPTVTTLHKRPLPEGDDLPEPRRRAEQTGERGRTGRKRGELQFRRVTVQHAGSGAWTHAHLSPGNGRGVADLELGLDAILETSARLQHPVERVLVRLDGEYGHVPAITALKQRGLHFITRLNRPALYDDPEVLRRLRAASWQRVPSSGCQPHRATAEIGVVTLKPCRVTKRPDGSAYDPVRVRVAASIFPKTGKATRGRVIDGWQVELFAVDLPPDAWPVPDAVGAYFGRNSEENRFAQEDREFMLDRIISYHLAGQEFASLVGLGLWNLRIARGFALEPPPADPPTQQPRHAMRDDRVPAQWPRDPKVQKLLDELDWLSLLARRPGWTWDPDSHDLRCPASRPLELISVRSGEQSPGRTAIIFSRPRAGCQDCVPRNTCFQSWSHKAARHAEFLVPASLADKLRRRLAVVRAEPPATIADAEGTPGPQLCMESLILPAVARRTYRECYRGASVRIELELPPPEPPRPRLLARDVADRQRRRETWSQKLLRYALPPSATVRLTVDGGHRLQQLLVPPSADRPGLGAAG